MLVRGDAGRRQVAPGRRADDELGDASRCTARRSTSTRVSIRSGAWSRRAAASGPTRPAGAPRHLTAEVEVTGLDTGAVPLLAPVLGLEAARRLRARRDRGPQLEEQVNQTVLAYLKALRARSWWPRTCTGSTTRRATLLAELIAREGVLVVATSRNLEPGELGDDRAAAALARRPARADRRARVRPARRGRAGARGPQRRRAALPRGAGARGPGGRRTPVAPVPGSVPAALYEPLVARLYATPDALPVAATAAAAGQAVDRSLLAATTALAAEQLDATLGTLVDAHDRAGRRTPASGSATSCCARSPTSCSRRRGGARSTAGSATCSPTSAGDWHVLAVALRARGALPRGGRGLPNTAEWARRRGALAEARAHLTRARRRDRRRTTTIARSSCACAAGSWRCRPRARGSADASADFERCLELAASDPRGDEMFSTLIALWAYDLSCGELDRAREISKRSARRAGRERASSHRRTSPASACSTGSTATSRAPSTKLARRTRELGAGRTRSPPRGSCPATRRPR